MIDIRIAIASFVLNAVLENGLAVHFVPRNVRKLYARYGFERNKKDRFGSSRELTSFSASHRDLVIQHVRKRSHW